MATQTMETPEDKFKHEWLDAYCFLQKVLDNVERLKTSTVAKKYSEVKRNLDLAYQSLEEAYMRFHKINDVMDPL